MWTSKWSSGWVLRKPLRGHIARVKVLLVEPLCYEVRPTCASSSEFMQLFCASAKIRKLSCPARPAGPAILLVARGLAVCF